MGTSKGNNKYITPEQLEQAFEDYKDHNAKNPFITNHYNIKSNTTGIVKHLPPLTMEGFSVFLAKNYKVKNLIDYVRNYNDSYNDYSQLVTCMKNEIFAHNVKGASVGAYNHNIIARQLGMVDKQEVTEKKEPLTRLEIEIELQKLMSEAQKAIE